MSKMPHLVTIKVSDETRKMLKMIAAATDKTMQDACYEAIKVMYEEKVLKTKRQYR